MFYDVDFILSMIPLKTYFVHRDNIIECPYLWPYIYTYNIAGLLTSLEAQNEIGNLAKKPIWAEKVSVSYSQLKLEVRHERDARSHILTFAQFFFFRRFLPELPASREKAKIQ
jgi:hypothetical protein